MLGRAFKNSRICCWVGWMIFKRSRSASWNVIDPFIASFVRRATSWPLPQNCANSSMPSSLITVESTSKHTICVFRITWAAPAAFFDLSPTIFLWFRLKGQRRRRRRRWEKRKCQKWNETKRPEMPHEINQMSSIGKGKWMEERGGRGGWNGQNKNSTAFRMHNNIQQNWKSQAKTWMNRKWRGTY